MENEFIAFKTGRNEITKVKIDDILYFKADGDYTHIKLTGENLLTISKNLKNTLENIESGFFIKINRSIVVNRLFITKIKTGKEATVQLSNNETFRPSKKYHTFLKQFFVHTSNEAVHTVKGGVSHIYNGHSHNKPDAGDK